MFAARAMFAILAVVVLAACGSSADRAAPTLSSTAATSQPQAGEATDVPSLGTTIGSAASCADVLSVRGTLMFLDTSTDAAAAALESWTSVGAIDGVFPCNDTGGLPASAAGTILGVDLGLVGATVFSPTGEPGVAVVDAPAGRLVYRDDSSDPLAFAAAVTEIWLRPFSIGPDGVESFGPVTSTIDDPATVDSLVESLRNATYLDTARADNRWTRSIELVREDGLVVSVWVDVEAGHIPHRSLPADWVALLADA